MYCAQSIFQCAAFCAVSIQLRSHAAETAKSLQPVIVCLTYLSITRQWLSCFFSSNFCHTHDTIKIHEVRQNKPLDYCIFLLFFCHWHKKRTCIMTIPVNLLINTHLATGTSSLQVSKTGNIYYHFTSTLALGQELSDRFTQDSCVF